MIYAFWNYVNLFVTNIIQAGLEQVFTLLCSCQLKRPDLALSLIAAGGNFLLIVACSIGFLRNRPQAREWAQFVCGGVLVLAYFAVIIATTGPEYIVVFKRALGL